MKKRMIIWLFAGAFFVSISGVSCSSAFDVVQVPTKRVKTHLKSYKNNSLPNRYNVVTHW